MRCLGWIHEYMTRKWLIFQVRKCEYCEYQCLKSWNHLCVTAAGVGSSRQSSFCGGFLFADYKQFWVVKHETIEMNMSVFKAINEACVRAWGPKTASWILHAHRKGNSLRSDYDEFGVQRKERTHVQKHISRYATLQIITFIALEERLAIPVET